MHPIFGKFFFKACYWNKICIFEVAIDTLFIAVGHALKKCKSQLVLPRKPASFCITILPFTYCFSLGDRDIRW